MLGIITLICSYALLTSNCTKPDVQDDDQQGVPAYKTENIRWDFNDADGWAYAHQDTATVKQWSVENGSLYLKTRAYTRDRSKMFTLKDDFQSGTYTWRIFVSNIAPYEQASIAGFIYQDDETAQHIGHQLTQSGVKELNLAVKGDFRVLLHDISELAKFLHPEH